MMDKDKALHASPCHTSTSFFLFPPASCRTLSHRAADGLGKPDGPKTATIVIKLCGSSDRHDCAYDLPGSVTVFLKAMWLFDLVSGQGTKPTTALLIDNVPTLVDLLKRG